MKKHGWSIHLEKLRSTALEDYFRMCRFLFINNLKIDVSLILQVIIFFFMFTSGRWWQSCHKLCCREAGQSNRPVGTYQQVCKGHKIWGPRIIGRSWVQLPGQCWKWIWSGRTFRDYIVYCCSESIQWAPFFFFFSFSSNASFIVACRWRPLIWIKQMWTLLCCWSWMIN